MNLNNISQIRYGGKDIVLGKLNGNIIYDKSIGPEQPEDSTESYYIEYTVASSTRRLNEGTEQYKYGIPSIMVYDNTYRFEYSKVEITLTNGTITDDLNTVCSNVSKIKLWYPKDTKSIKFVGSSTYKPLVKTVDYVKTDNFTTMSRMFYYCQSLTSVNTTDWNTSKVTDMSAMFYQCSALLSLDLSSFDTRNVTYANYMFAYASGTVNMSNFVINRGNILLYAFQNSKITSVTANNLVVNGIFQGTFTGASKLTTVDLTGSDFSNCTDINALFWNCSSLSTIINSGCLFPEKIKVIDRVFYNCSRLSLRVNLSGNVNYLQGVSYAFANMKSITLDMEGNYLNITSTEGMFEGTEINVARSTISVGFPNNKNMSRMFKGSNCSKGGNFYIKNMFENIEDMSYAFDGARLYNVQLVDKLSIGFVYNLVAPNCYNYEYVLANGASVYFNVSIQGNCRSAFEGSNDVSVFAQGPITDASNMFRNCSGSYIYGISDLDMSQCYDMSYMFAECYNLQELDIYNWNVTSCTTTNSMFYECTSLYSLNLRDWETYNIYDYYDMFYNVPDSCTITVRYNYFTLNESDTGFNGSFNWEW